MIRDFMEKDREDYIRLSDAFYHSSAVMHAIPKENFEETFRQIMQKNPYARGLIIEHEGKTAGYALLALTYSNEVAGLVVWPEEVYIDPAFQGHGLGTGLFRFLEREYEGRVKRFRLEVTSVNEGAIRLYKKLGYESFDYLQMVKDYD